jgi:integrase/recombinase XerD
MRIEETLSLFLAGYFSTCRRAAKTEAAYRTDLTQFQAHFGPGTELQAVGSEDLERWATALTDEGYAAVSVRRKFATARVLFNYWVRKGVLEHSPFWKIRLDLAREQQLPRNIPITDAKRLLEQAWLKVERSAPEITAPRDARFLAWRNVAAIEVLFATGMRVGELVSLTLPAWNEEECSFIVKGKGARQRLAILTDHRSLEAVSTYLRHRRGMRLEHESFLVNAAGGPLSSQGVARALSRLATAAGITTRVTPHMIRHTVATLLLRNGADIRVVQEVLGHSSIAMTQRYTHVSKEHLRATLQLHHPNHHFAINTYAQATLF